eukprot:625122-Ditylum_brightwellii.AAC.1
MTDEEKLHYPYTWHCYFVPFNANGAITTEMIFSVMEVQNHFLEVQTSVTVIGFAGIETTVPDPDYIKSDDPSLQDIESPTVRLIC